MTSPIEILRYRLKRFGLVRGRADGVADDALRELLGGQPADSSRDRGAAQSEPSPSAAPPLEASAERDAVRPTGGGVRIVARRQLTEDLLMLRIERPAGFDFVPGQHLRLGLDGMTRKYTICSSPHEPWLELFVERQPGGTFTPRLFALREGDAVRIAKGASGSFTLEPDVSDHVMVATVTGIAPFVSMTRAAAHAGASDRFHVLHGASYMDELGYADELAGDPAVQYLPTVSRPAEPRNAGWTGATGRVGEHLEPYLEEHGLTPDRAVVYACGNPRMIDDVRARMKPRGYRVLDESYD